MNEHTEKRKFLFDDLRILLNPYNKRAGEEFNFLHCANEIFHQEFAVLIFCFFWIKPKEEIHNQRGYKYGIETKC